MCNCCWKFYSCCGSYHFMNAKPHLHQPARQRDLSDIVASAEFNIIC